MDSYSKEYLSQYAPEGSSLYYACLYYPKAHKHLILALYGFYVELIKIRSHISDPGIARIKLQWWRQEIQKISSGSSQHPLIQNLSQCNKQHQFNFNQLSTIIDVEESIIQKHFLTEEEKINTYQNTIGLIWQLGCEPSNPLSSIEQKNIKQAAAVIECFNEVLYFHENNSYSKTNLSLEFLKSQQVSREILDSMDKDTIWNQVIKPYIEIQQEKLALLLDSEISNHLLPFIMAKIYSSRARKILKPKIPKSTDILPIKKFFIAWSSYRRFRSS